MSTQNILGGVAAVLVAMVTVFSCVSPVPEAADDYLGARGAPPVGASAGLEQVVQAAISATPEAPYMEAGWGGACCIGNDGAIIAAECGPAEPPALATTESSAAARLSG